MELRTPTSFHMFVVNYKYRTVGLYETFFSQPKTTFTAHGDLLQDIAVSHNSMHILTTALDSTSQVWNLRGIPTKKATLIGHKSIVLTARFSHDDRLIVTGSKDETLGG
jgi:WD40 repeat protein